MDQGIHQMPHPRRRDRQGAASRHGGREVQTQIELGLAVMAFRYRKIRTRSLTGLSGQPVNPWAQ
jgi:hypothetical protein